MKKLTMVILVMAVMLLVGTAVAQTAAFGAFAVMLPEDIQQEEVTREEQLDGMTAYYSNDAFDMAVYQSDNGGQSLNEIINGYLADGDIEQSGTVTLNGIEVGYYLYRSEEEDGDYYVVCYVIPDGDALYEIAFFVLNDAEMQASSAETAKVMETLARVR